MSTIRIDLRGAAGQRPESVLMHNLGHAGSGDEINITMDRTKAHEMDGLFAVLEHEGFDVLPKGGHGDDTYNIIAHRKQN